MSPRALSPSIVALAFVLGAARAEGAILLGTSTTSTRAAEPKKEGFWVEIGAQVFAETTARSSEGGDFEQRYALSRARLSASVHLGEELEARIEPDFSGAPEEAGIDVGLGDVYVQLRPIEELRLRVGRAKSPFGTLEWTGRFDLPTRTRGLISSVVASKLDFGGRRFGVHAALRLNDLPLKPSLYAGAYADLGSSERSEDAAIRAGVRPMKGLRVEAAVYSRAGALRSGGRGTAGALSARYERAGVFAVLEGLAGRARLLRRDALASTTDATFLGARVLGAYRMPAGGEVALEPFVAAELLDPNADTRDDRGVALRGGINAIYRKVLRLGFEADRQTGEVGFVAGRSTSLTLLLAIALD